MVKSFSIRVQHLGLQHVLSRIIGWVANCKWRWFKNWAIRRFIRKYHINVEEVQITDVEAYPNFNSFFIRKLKPNARPIAPGLQEIACPVDGTISQIGRIEDDVIFQAKGYHFTLPVLLGSSQEAALFRNGYFATFYLAPRDYHRVHMPFSGKLKSTRYIPGKLFSVNGYTTDNVPGLFARNERLVCLFETKVGPMMVILVGAMLVSGIHTVWESNCRGSKVIEQAFTDGKFLAKGAELGYFRMGSTVIVLFPKQTIKWNAILQHDIAIKMGEEIGKITV